MRHLFLCFSAVAATLAFTQSPAKPIDAGGTLTVAEGRVRVSQDGMYVAGYAGMPLTVKDRVLVLNDGKAVVTHADGCITELGSNSLFVFEQPSPCQGGIAAIRAIAPVKVAMPETAGAATGGGFLGGLSMPVVAGISTLVVGGMVGGIIAATDSGGGGLSDEELLLLRQRSFSAQ